MILLFNQDVLEPHWCLNPFYSHSSSIPISIQDLHFEKKWIKPTPDMIFYFTYKTREGDILYLLYQENKGFFIFTSLSKMIENIQFSKLFNDDLFPCMRIKHYMITQKYINTPDDENIKHYDWLKCGHIESNYHYEKMKDLVTFCSKTEKNEISKKQIIDSFQYLLVTPTFYSIFYYEHKKYKIYNQHISQFQKPEDDF
jgi:hypothetical protein